MSFFLDRLAESADNHFVFRCYFSAFASAAMSVLYALDSARKTIDPKFVAWYEPRRLRLIKEDSITSYVLDRRREAVHVGETRVRSGRMSRGDSGEPVFEHFFSLHLGQPESVAVDVLSACEHTHRAICGLVDEVPEVGPSSRAALINSDWTPCEQRSKEDQRGLGDTGTSSCRQIARTRPGPISPCRGKADT